MGIMIILKGLGYGFLKTIFRDYDKDDKVINNDVNLMWGFKK